MRFHKVNDFVVEQRVWESPREEMPIIGMIRKQ